MSDLDKINIYVPDSVGMSLNNDAELFEIYKKDGKEINRNKFLNMLLKGYYETYIRECNAIQEKLFQKLNEAIPNSSARKRCANEILNEIVLPASPPRKGNSSRSLSLKPTRDTEGLINQIKTSPGSDNSVSQHFCKMIMSYCRKPIYERERIIFKETYDTLQDACAAKVPVAFSTKGDPKTVYTVIPYCVETGKEEFFNYLLCQEFNSKTKRNETRAYRLNRITYAREVIGDSVISDDVQANLNKMLEYGPQYAINCNNEICVKLSKKGEKAYKLIYFGRPKYKKSEVVDDGTLLYFDCSADQIFYYFRRFKATEAVILSPESLVKRMYAFHHRTALVYERANSNLNKGRE